MCLPGRVISYDFKAWKTEHGSKLTDMIIRQMVSIGASNIAIACTAVPNISFRAFSSLLARVSSTAAMKSAEDFCRSLIV